jgi:Cys-tRNA(Pro) deacylase
MEDDGHNPFIVLMHGDQQVSTKMLARHLGVKHINPCDPEVADKHSGYHVGGTSPFGTRRNMPVYCQASIADLPKIYINGGSRGYIISMRTIDMLNLLAPTLLDCAQGTDNKSQEPPE